MNQPTSRESSERLRRAASDFWWTPDHVVSVEEPNLTLCYSPSADPLYNQAVPHGSLTNDVKTIERVRSLHGGASRWWVTEVCDDDLESRLLDAGYNEGDRHGAYIVETQAARFVVPEDVNVESVETMDQMREMFDVRCEIFGSPQPTDDELALQLAQCTGGDARVGRMIARIGGVCVGTGSLTYFDDLSLSFIWAGGVKESYRGRGIYKALVQARAKACAARGIEFMGLYAKDATSGPIVAAHGFERCGAMTYFELKL